MNERWHSTPQRRALVTGATGLVGRALLRALAGNAVATTRRVSSVTYLEGASELVPWDTVSTLPLNALAGVDAIFHLAGEPVVGLLRFAAGTDTLHGPLNAAAPGTVANAEFTRALGRAVHRPALLRAPRFALELALGEVAAVVLASQRVVPKRALDAGFEFAHPTLDEALAATLEGKSTSTSYSAAGGVA